QLERKRATLPAKSVIFTRFTTVAVELARRLEVLLPHSVALLHAGQSSYEAEDQIEHFRASSTAGVLVCDRSGEEGTNLQYAQRPVLFDLPLDPFALEQRIGRLDRLTRRLRHLPSVVLLGDGGGEGFDEAWFGLMAEGFGVFAGPISDLHLYAE